MATDGFVLLFWIPVLLISGVLCFAYFFARKGREFSRSFGKLSGRRVFLGICGSLLAAAIYALINSVQVGFGKIDQGIFTFQEMLVHVPSYFIYLYVLFVPFVLLGVGIIGIPSIFLLEKFRLASFVGIVLICLVVSTLWGLKVYFFPYNNWCDANQLACFRSNFASMIFACIIVGGGFSLGARLPLWRNSSA